MKKHVRVGVVEPGGVDTAPGSLEAAAVAKRWFRRATPS